MNASYEIPSAACTSLMVKRTDVHIQNTSEISSSTLYEYRYIDHNRQFRNPYSSETRKFRLTPLNLHLSDASFVPAVMLVTTQYK